MEIQGQEEEAARTARRAKVFAELQISEERFAALKKEHGEDLHFLHAIGRVFLVRAPPRKAWHQFREKISRRDNEKAEEKEGRRVAMENFAVACAIIPAPQQLGQLFEVRPALAETLANKLSEIAGLDEEASILLV